MELIHVETCEDARREIRRRMEAEGGSGPLYRVVESPCTGFDVVTIEPDLYADALAGDLIDGLSILPRLGKRPLRDW